MWKVALDTGANVLALNVIEAAASSPRMIERRNMLNAMIKAHQEAKLYAIFAHSSVHATTASSLLIALIMSLPATPSTSTAPFLTPLWTKPRARSSGMTAFI